MLSFLNFSSRTTPDRDLPFPVYKALIENLFRGTRSNVAGVFAYLLLAISIISSPPTFEMRISAMIFAIACISRISADFTCLRRFRDGASRSPTSCDDVEGRELRYLAISAFFAGAFGMAIWFAVIQPVGEVIRLLIIVASAIFVVSGSGRCCGSPRVVFVQTLLVVAPFGAAMIKVGGFGGYFAALMTLFVMRNMRDTTRSLHGTLVSMLMGNLAVTDTATKFDTALNNMSGGLVMIDSERVVSVANKQFTAMFALGSEPVGQDIDRLIRTGVEPWSNARRIWPTSSPCLTAARAHP